MNIEAQSLSLKISLNGAPVSTRTATLTEFLIEQGFGNRKVATAINGEFVTERARAATPLSSGDRIEVLSARQGG